MSAANRRAAGMDQADIDAVLAHLDAAPSTEQALANAQGMLDALSAQERDQANAEALTAFQAERAQVVSTPATASPYVDGVLPGSVAEGMRRYAQAHQEPTPGQQRRWRLYDQALIAEHDAHQDGPQ